MLILLEGAGGLSHHQVPTVGASLAARHFRQTGQLTKEAIAR